MTKVIRVSDGKIFSSPRGAALYLGKPLTKRVYYCCKGYIDDVDGEKYEWYFDEDNDRGKPEITELSAWSRKSKWSASSAGWNEYNRVRETIAQRSIVIKLWLDAFIDHERWRTSTELCNEWSIFYEASKNDIPQFPWIFTPTIVSRHLHAYNLIYAKMFGMHENTVNVPWYKGRIFKFVKEDADPDFDILSSEVVVSDRGNSKPVIRVNDGMRFSSMIEAERVTGISTYNIFHCCEGDLRFIQTLDGEKMEFRYATEIERK